MQKNSFLSPKCLILCKFIQSIMRKIIPRIESHILLLSHTSKRVNFSTYLCLVFKVDWPSEKALCEGVKNAACGIDQRRVRKWSSPQPGIAIAAAGVFRYPLTPLQLPSASRCNCPIVAGIGESFAPQLPSHLRAIAH